jgi:hypothetical protein
MGLIDKIKDTISNFTDGGLDHYHLNKEDGKWKFQKSGADRSVRNFDKKDEAMKYAIDYLDKHRGQLKIYKEDGSLQEERTYPPQEEAKA